MRLCLVCGGTEFEEITEDEVYQAAADGVIDHPDDLQAALDNLGMQCTACGSMLSEDSDE